MSQAVLKCLLYCSVIISDISDLWTVWKRNIGVQISPVVQEKVYSRHAYGVQIS
jgi:hypothetical protein